MVVFAMISTDVTSQTLATLLKAGKARIESRAKELTAMGEDGESDFRHSSLECLQLTKRCHSGAPRLQAISRPRSIKARST